MSWWWRPSARAAACKQALVSRARQGITEGLVHVADADPDMGYESRTDLVRELCPHLPDAAVRRIGRSTATFEDVFAVASAPRLAEITAGKDEDEARLLTVVDAVVSALLRRPDPSPEAVIIAWAGGLLHAQQAARALGVLGLPQAAGADPDVLRWGDLERVTDPASPRLAGQVTVLAVRDRQAMAAVLLDEALRITADPGCGLVERMAAAQAAHQGPRRPGRPQRAARRPARAGRGPGGTRRAGRRAGRRRRRVGRLAARRQRR